MELTSVAAKVWAYLVDLGCEARVSERRGSDGAAVYRVEIWHRDGPVAIEEHAALGVASSRAILDAVQLVAPRPAPARRARPFGSVLHLPTGSHARPR